MLMVPCEIIQVSPLRTIEPLPVSEREMVDRVVMSAPVVLAIRTRDPASESMDVHREPVPREKPSHPDPLADPCASIDRVVAPDAVVSAVIIAGDRVDGVTPPAAGG